MMMLIVGLLLWGSSVTSIAALLLWLIYEELSEITKKISSQCHSRKEITDIHKVLVKKITPHPFQCRCRQ